MSTTQSGVLARGTFLALTFTLLLFGYLHSELAVVARDGSLVFQNSSVDSAVLDILPRGTRIELTGRMGNWCEVRLDTAPYQGFIQTESLIMAGKESAYLTPETAIRQPAPLTLENLQRKLADSESRIAKVEQMLDKLEQVVEQTAPSAQAQTGMIPLAPSTPRNKAESREGAWEQGPVIDNFLAASPLGVSVYGGYFRKAGEYTLGGALTWRPGFLGRFGIELDFGSTRLENELDAQDVSLGAVFTLPWSFLSLQPYLAGGGGMLRISAKDGDLKNKIYPTADLGLGAVRPLLGGFCLRTDLRAFARFYEQEKSYEQRALLALEYNF